MAFAAPTKTKSTPSNNNTPSSIVGLLKNRTFLGFFSIVRQYKVLYVISLTAQFVGIGLSLLFADTSRRLFDAAPHVPSELIVPSDNNICRDLLWCCSD